LAIGGVPPVSGNSPVPSLPGGSANANAAGGVSNTKVSAVALQGMMASRKGSGDDSGNIGNMVGMAGIARPYPSSTPSPVPPAINPALVMASALNPSSIATNHPMMATNVAQGRFPTQNPAQIALAAATLNAAAAAAQLQAHQQQQLNMNHLFRPQQFQSQLPVHLQTPTAFQTNAAYMNTLLASAALGRPFTPAGISMGGVLPNGGLYNSMLAAAAVNNQVSAGIQQQQQQQHQQQRPAVVLPERMSSRPSTPVATSAIPATFPVSVSVPMQGPIRPNFIPPGAGQLRSNMWPTNSSPIPGSTPIPPAPTPTPPPLQAGPGGKTVSPPPPLLATTPTPPPPQTPLPPMPMGPVPIPPSPQQQQQASTTPTPMPASKTQDKVAAWVAEISSIPTTEFETNEGPLRRISRRISVWQPDSESEIDVDDSVSHVLEQNYKAEVLAKIQTLANNGVGNHVIAQLIAAMGMGNEETVSLQQSLQQQYLSQQMQMQQQQQQQQMKFQQMAASQGMASSAKNVLQQGQQQQARPITPVVGAT
ncbi:hypothetical protein HDU76_010295, partial [Blyttiomyces sp. JEL0837]